MSNNNNNNSTTAPTSSSSTSSTDVIMTEANVSSETVLNTTTSTTINNTSNTSPLVVTEEDERIDSITALQDGIDGLSLAMFEALRGLRDAVAPESGNLGQTNHQTPNNNNNSTDEPADASNNNSLKNPQQQQQQRHNPDAEELWQAYRVGDPSVEAFFHKATHELGVPMPKTREDVVSLHAQLEDQRDTQLVHQLAQILLTKSHWINQQVDHHIPGMHRTRTQQMARIEELLQENALALQDLRETHALAVQKQRQCRQFVEQHTCAALGIQEQ